MHAEASSLKRVLEKVTKRNNLMRNNIAKHAYKVHITDVKVHITDLVKVKHHFYCIFFTLPLFCSFVLLPPCCLDEFITLILINLPSILLSAGIPSLPKKNFDQK